MGAQKDHKAAEKAIQKVADKKAALENVLATEFAMLKEGTSASAAGKKAEKKLVQLGKAHGLDATLLSTFPITCKKPVANRTEFENMMFNSLQALVDKAIGGLAQEIAAANPDKQAKEATEGRA